MNQSFVIFISIIMLFFVSCNSKNNTNNEQTSKLSAIDKIEGIWYKLPIEDSKKFVEVWERSSVHSFSGNAYLLNSNENEKFNTERLWLNFKYDRWIYTAELFNKDRTDFENTIINDTLLRFENLQHDFPQYIQYHFLSNKKLKIETWNAEQKLAWEMEKQ